MSKRFQPTPMQIALAEERKAKKVKLAGTATASAIDDDKGRILSREWIQLQSTDNVDDVRHLKIMTWNLLAQTLVRRELFPTSDCLKAAQREHMLYNEILSHNANIMCLQEVDRLEKLLPVLENAGYLHTYAAGPRKKHGCLIAYGEEQYTKVHERVIRYDDQDIRTNSEPKTRRGSSFRTKNIGFMAALKRKGTDEEGVIVATTHLFWHPKYTYERARQAGILIREVAKFREDIGHNDWPCFICGDFNFAPDDPAYSLLVGDPLLACQEERLANSRVVHVTIDPDVPPAPLKTSAEDEEGGEVGETDPDRIITNARLAISSDGLLTNTELANLYSTPVRSAYDEGMFSYRKLGGDVVTYGDRVPLPSRRGINEPEWTSYTHYWKTVLDYIFILDPPDKRSVVIGLSRPHRTEDLDPGLPRKGVCGSDHISLSAEIML